MSRWGAAQTVHAGTEFFLSFDSSWRKISFLNHSFKEKTVCRALTVWHTDVLLHITPRDFRFFSSTFPFEAENNSQSSTAAERENERLFNCGLLHQLYFSLSLSLSLSLFGCAKRERNQSSFFSNFIVTRCSVAVYVSAAQNNKRIAKQVDPNCVWLYNPLYSV